MDIGSAFVRAAALRRSRDGWALVSAGEAPITDGRDVRVTLHDLLDRLNLRRVQISVAVPAGAAVVRRLPVPANSLADLDRHVSLEAEQLLPFGSHEANVSYQVLDRHQKGTHSRSSIPDGLDMVLAAARRSEVAERAAVVAGPGRRAGVADVEGIALANAFTLNYPDQSDSALLIHLGHRTTVIGFVERGELLSTRGVGVGPEVFAAVRHTASPAEVQRIFLSGGGWQNEEVAARLRAEFATPIEPLDPVRRIRTLPTSRGSSVVGPPFALAVGLALRRLGDR